MFNLLFISLCVYNLINQIPDIVFINNCAVLNNDDARIGANDSLKRNRVACTEYILRVVKGCNHIAYFITIDTQTEEFDVLFTGTSEDIEWFVFIDTMVIKCCYFVNLLFL